MVVALYRDEDGHWPSINIDGMVTFIDFRRDKTRFGQWKPYGDNPPKVASPGDFWHKDGQPGRPDDGTMPRRSASMLVRTFLAGWRASYRI
jgi:hypothetical protein